MLPIRFIHPLLKKAYGYDVSGQVGEASGSGVNQKNIEDTATPDTGHQTPKNPTNFMHDNAAEEFPEVNRPSKIRFLPPRGLR